MHGSTSNSGSSLLESEKDFSGFTNFMHVMFRKVLILNLPRTSLGLSYSEQNDESHGKTAYLEANGFSRLWVKVDLAAAAV
jgi:hypothetical protein